ncbi:MAG: hypothetical protein V2A54_17125 [Bacteroidota bacterium]
MPDRRIFVAIPLLNELNELPELLDCLSNQEAKAIHILFCVNQSDDWHSLPDKKDIIQANTVSIEYLKKQNHLPLIILDRSSKGNGWIGKKHGVGWARKALLDLASDLASPDDILISLDADTRFSKNYFSSIISSFNAFPKAIALSNPYYHKLSGDELLDRSILRYEIYMRSYAINLLRIQSPYAFTALGSAIAVLNSAYKKIGGITPKLSGEDFYFLQKLCKAGIVNICNDESVYPGTRYSERVYFGTGPALIKGSQGDWDSYPVYHPSLFDTIHNAYELFPALFENPELVCSNDFLKFHFNDATIFHKIKKNNNNINQFTKACHELLDGLKILQFVKQEQNKIVTTEENCLWDLLEKYPSCFNQILAKDLNKISFSSSPVHLLNKLRDHLVLLEKQLQNEHMTSLRK